MSNLNTYVIEKTYIKTKVPSDDYAITFFLVVLAFFIHPYILTIIAAVFQLWFKIKLRFFLPVYAISFAVFWASRNYVVLGDDAIEYINQFQMMHYNDITLLVRNYISAPSGNELLYTLYVYTISIFTSDERVFGFFIYLLIASLISVAAVLIHRRYYMVVIAVSFFGIGSFAGLEVFHLWRSLIASLLFVISVMYYSKNRRVAVLIMLSACLVHLIVILMAFLFLIVQINKYTKNKYILPVTSFLFFLAFVIFVTYFVSYIDIFAAKDVAGKYLNSDINDLGSLIKTQIVLLLYYLLNRNKLDYRSSYIIFCLFFILLLLFLFPVAIVFTGRFYQAYSVFVALMFFEIIMSIKNKYLIMSVLVTLFVLKFYALGHDQMIQQSFADFNNLSSGILFMIL